MFAFQPFKIDFLRIVRTWDDWAIFHLNGTQLISSFKPRNIFYLSSFHLLESGHPHFFIFLVLLRLYHGNEFGVMKDAFSLIYVLLRYSIITMRIYHGNFSFLQTKHREQEKKGFCTNGSYLWQRNNVSKQQQVVIIYLY